MWFARNVGSKTQPEFTEYARLQAEGKDLHAGSEARIAVADLDGDGRKDLLVGGGTGIVWFFQASQPKQGAEIMKFLDDDCPDVSISVARVAALKNETHHTIQVTARPAPARDTEISYSVGGSAISGVDYEALSGTVTIPAGETSATIVIKPFRQASAQEKSVVLTLPSQPFTYFDFFRYLTPGRPRTASIQITSSTTSPLPLKPGESISASEDAAVVKLRSEVSGLG